MKRMLTGKTFITLGLVCVSFLLPAAAFPWNQATHAYISDRLGARMGNDNLQEMWGSVAPDFFNYIFDPAVCPGWVSDQTHGTCNRTCTETFLKVWEAAESEKEDALAYGFLSHNEAWGADHVAHEASITLGGDEGYIIIKAKKLLDEPLESTSLQTFGDVFESSFGMSDEQALLVAHGISEYAIDIMLGREVDPRLGRKLATAARSETKRFADLLVKAYAADYAVECFGGDEATAASVLTAAEKGHRKDMIYLGQAISRPEPVAVQLLAEQLVAILPDLLGDALDGGLPGNAVEIIEAGILRSMDLCDDYKAEIAATIEFVAGNLKSDRIAYEYQGKRDH